MNYIVEKIVIKKYYPIIFSALIIFIIRLLFGLLPPFGFDMGTWFGWASRLNSLGFAHFYSSTDWTQYTPGFMYYLWIVGKFGLTNDWAIKVPAVLSDIGTGLLIWKLISKRNQKLGLISFFLYTLNPVVIFDSSVWGQIDGLLTLLMFLSAYFLIEKRNFIVSVLIWSVAFLVKPQAIAVAPIFLLVILLQKFRWKEVFLGIMAGLLLLFIGSIEFFPQNPVFGLPALVLKMTNYYSYTSVNAFNIWTWVGMWQPDTAKFLNLPLAYWGVIFLILSDLIALFIFRNKLSLASQSPGKLNSKPNYYLLFAIHSLAFFVFPTKVHERYLFPFFAFLLTSAGLSNSLNLFGIYIVSSFASFLNLYYPYSYYYPAQIRSDVLYNLSLGLSKIIGFIFFAAYFLLLFWEKLPELRFPRFSKPKAVNVRLPKIYLSKKSAKMMLYMILTFAFVSRVFNLGSPSTMYFDEVYHAFTAKIVLTPTEAHKAWEWWNTPPSGFAYEWTHPPLAKLGMALGMIIFGQNSFGWRIPGAILGTFSVLLVYLIAKEIFADEAVSLLSTAVFSLDGLALVMSRIGMNDSYILFFALLSILFYLRKKNFLSALTFGFALASKWSAIWTVPILGIVFLSEKRKLTLSYIWFFILPPLIYLSTYFQMFLTGHSLSTWWEMQKQMWWYHTGLRATHPYFSPWWEWPLMIRPIYLYTSSEAGGWVARIYAIGNPLVFWFGLLSVIICLIYAWFEKNKHLAFVVFAYLIFFVPWALSPRIMFLYHYLPSIPFLAIATGYVLRRNPKLTLGYLVIGLLLFIYFYPHWAGLKVPLWLDQSYYWVPSWR